MEAPPQSQAYSQWYTLSSPYVPEGSIYRSYPSPAPSDPSPLPRSHQMLDYAPVNGGGDVQAQEYHIQMKPNFGPTLPKLRRSSNGRVAPHASYADLNTAGLHLDRPKEPVLPPTPSSMISPYHIHPPSQPPMSRRDRPRSSSPANSSASLSSSGFDNQVPSQVGAVRTTKHHRKQRLRDSDRKLICLYQREHDNARQEDIAREFGVERSTISKILKSKDRWLNINLDDESNEQTSKHRPSKFPEVEWEMLKSLQEWSDNGINITDNLIRDRALEIARNFQISPDRFKGSSGWIENFKHRHEIRRGEWLKAKERPPRPDITITPPTLSYDPPASTPSTNRSSSSQLPQVHDHAEPRPEDQMANQHWSPAQQHPRHQQQQQSSLSLDPALQDASSGSHPLHNQDTAIQHSPQQAADYSAYFGQGLYVPPGGYRGPADVEHPTLAEAEIAINTVITYVARCDKQDLLLEDERRALRNIKAALFQYSSGIPYPRPPP